VKAIFLWGGAFTAGFLGWRVAAPSPPPARASSPEASPAPEAPPLPDAAEVREIRRRLGLLATVPLREFVRYGKEPLADRMRRAKGLAEAERRETLREWARFAVYDRPKALEMLALVRLEEDREILAWLAEMIDFACLMKMNLDPTFTDEEKRAMYPLALGGEPFERRIAALRVIGGDRQNGLPAEVQALLGGVLRTDPEPAVVATAAEEIEQRYAPETHPALLDAYRRLPQGEPRKKVARAYAKWASWPEVKDRFLEARDPAEYDAWAAASSAWLTFFKEGWEADLPEIYRQTGARDIRRDFFFRLANTAPPRVDLMRKLADLEPDAGLRARYVKVLAAADPKDPLALARIDVWRTLQD
jgi:hypothetical protein